MKTPPRTFTIDIPQAFAVDHTERALPSGERRLMRETPDTYKDMIGRLVALSGHHPGEDAERGLFRVTGLDTLWSPPRVVALVEHLRGASDPIDQLQGYGAKPPRPFFTADLLQLHGVWLLDEALFEDWVRIDNERHASNEAARQKYHEHLTAIRQHHERRLSNIAPPPRVVFD